MTWPITAFRPDPNPNTRQIRGSLTKPTPYTPSPYVEESSREHGGKFPSPRKKEPQTTAPYIQFTRQNHQPAGTTKEEINNTKGKKREKKGGFSNPAGVDA